MGVHRSTESSRSSQLGEHNQNVWVVKIQLRQEKPLRDTKDKRSPVILGHHHLHFYVGSVIRNVHCYNRHYL